MTLRSHQSASSKPPATAGPATAALTGFVSSSREGPIGPRGTAPPPAGKSRVFSGSEAPASLEAYLRSQPAQKAPPAPQNTATAASGSRSNARKASTSASALSGSMALRASGRAWMTVVTGPFFSTVTVMACSSARASPLPQGAGERNAGELVRRIRAAPRGGSAVAEEEALLDLALERVRDLGPVELDIGV